MLPATVLMDSKQEIPFVASLNQKLSDSRILLRTQFELSLHMCKA